MHCRRDRETPELLVVIVGGQTIGKWHGIQQVFFARPYMLKHTLTPFLPNFWPRVGCCRASCLQIDVVCYGSFVGGVMLKAPVCKAVIQMHMIS
jgi:hypothetical protein